MIPAALPLLPLLLQSPAAISCGPCFVMLPGPCTGGTRGRRRHCMLAGAAGTSAPPRWSEVRISESPIDKPLGEEDPGETLKRGETVVLLPRIASLDACAALVDTCLRETKAERLGCEDVESPALVRRVLDDLPADVRTACESILSGVLARLDAQLPSVAAAHFPDESRSLSELLAGNALEWAWREPAVIVYSQGSDGYAQTPHFDGQALTMLVPLSDPERDFEGGGTGFWPHSEPRPEDVQAPTVLRPPPGTALVFGGRCAKHCGLPVERGARVVFVASFTPAPPLTPERISQLKFQGKM